MGVDDPAVTASAMENLWVRLKVGDRLRPRDALLLRRLGLPPFEGSAVYETDSRGYIVGVGTPGQTRRVDPDAVVTAFEKRFGTPQSCHGDFAGGKGGSH